ncbi:hypothetical protein ABIE12_001048 [Serratia sp. 509]
MPAGCGIPQPSIPAFTHQINTMYVMSDVVNLNLKNIIINHYAVSSE